MTTIPPTMTVPLFGGDSRITTHERPVPEPGPGQLLLQVRANALCGSEMGQYRQGSAITPGHEAAGVVAAAGAGTHTAVGTPGVVFLMDFCGECRSCQRGATNQCRAKRADMGFTHDGGYGAYELVHENVFFPVDDDLPLTEATLLLDIMGTGGHALGRAQLVCDDIRSVLVTGAGPIGLGVLAMAKILLGPETPVLITDVAPYRLALAEHLGGLPINVKTETLEEGMKRLGWERVDVALDTSGKQQARQEAVKVLDQRAALVCVGHGQGVLLTVSRDLIAPERAVLGSEYFRFDELPGNLEHLRRHREALRPIITHTFPVTEIQQAFDLFFSGATGKVIVTQ